MFDLRSLAAALFFTLMMESASADTDFAPLQDNVVLTVRGSIDGPNAENVAVFDMQALQALDVTEFETTTIWTEGPQKFTGVALSTLLHAIGAEGNVLLATAVNNYSVDIPVTDATDDGPIIAYLLNDEVMTVRDKGPLWIVYPYDSKPEYRQELIYTRSIWQLTHIEVRE